MKSNYKIERTTQPKVAFWGKKKRNEWTPGKTDQETKKTQSPNRQNEGWDTTRSKRE